MESVIAVVIGVAVLGFVTKPLWSSPAPARRRANPTTQRMQHLQHERELAYAALRELELDYRTGKLSEEDFRPLMQRYEKKALEVLHEISSLQEAEERDASLEPDGHPARHPDRPSVGLSCLRCGREVDPADRYCGGCGERLGGICKSCGYRYGPVERFCRNCGGSLTDLGPHPADGGKR